MYTCEQISFYLYYRRRSMITCILIIEDLIDDYRESRCLEGDNCTLCTPIASLCHLNYLCWHPMKLKQVYLQVCTRVKGNRQKKIYFLGCPTTKALSPPPHLSGRTTKKITFFATSLIDFTNSL